MSEQPYFQKLDRNPYESLAWNIPEQKQGSIGIIGGNAQSFRTEIRIAEFLAQHYPIKDIRNILPNTLQSQLPPLDNFTFLPATDSGSFAESDSLIAALNANDFNLISGDFSKNSITAKAIHSACISSEKPTLLARDAIDLIAAQSPAALLSKSSVILFASMAQLQKLFRSIYYPKVILLSMSILQASEALHKFTLSYPVTLITFHNNQILVANNGQIASISLDQTIYSPLTLWLGEPAAKIAVMNLFNPNQPFAASISALF